MDRDVLQKKQVWVSESGVAAVKWIMCENQQNLMSSFVLLFCVGNIQTIFYLGAKNNYYKQSPAVKKSKQLLVDCLNNSTKMWTNSKIEKFWFNENLNIVGKVR